MGRLKITAILICILAILGNTGGGQASADTSLISADNSSSHDVLMENGISPIADTCASPVGIGNGTDAHAGDRTMPGNCTPVVEDGPVLSLGRHSYYPGDTVTFYVFCKSRPLATVIDTYGNAHDIMLNTINSTAFQGSYALDCSILLSDYTVKALDVNTGLSVEGRFSVVARNVTTVPDNDTEGAFNNTAIDDRTHWVQLKLSKNDYFPGDHVDITINVSSGIPDLIVVDPVGLTTTIDLNNDGNNTFRGTYKLDRAIVLGNYSVEAKVAGNGIYYRANARFSVMDRATYARNSSDVDFIAYDPVLKAIVLRANAVSDVYGKARGLNDISALSGLHLQGMELLPGGVWEISLNDLTPDRIAEKEASHKKVDILIPLSDENLDVLSLRYGLSRDITGATVSAYTDLDRMKVHITLNNKTDGCWYRISYKIPEGYQVEKITCDDGREIRNYHEIDDKSGHIFRVTTNWYVDNGTLYFYDDPANSYEVLLSPVEGLKPASGPEIALMDASARTKTLYLQPGASGTNILKVSPYNGSHTTYLGNNILFPQTVSWDQDPALAGDLIISSNVTVTLYVNYSWFYVGDDSLRVRLISVNPSSQGQVIGSSTRLVQRSSSNNIQKIVFTIPVSGEVTIPRGGHLRLELTKMGNTFSIFEVYQSSIECSRVDILTLTHIRVAEAGIYDGNVPVDSVMPPGTITVRSNVTDPFGVSDIKEVKVAFYNSSGLKLQGIPELAMEPEDTQGDMLSWWRTYTASVTLPSGIEEGNYYAEVTAVDTNLVTDSLSIPFRISYPYDILARKTISDLGNDVYCVTLTLSGNDKHKQKDVYVYDFYTDQFSLSEFSPSGNRVSIPVDMPGHGYMNIFGPYDLNKGETLAITYNATGSGDYRLSDLYFVGVV